MDKSALEDIQNILARYLNGEDYRSTLNRLLSHAVASSGLDLALILQPNPQSPGQFDTVASVGDTDDEIKSYSRDLVDTNQEFHIKMASGRMFFGQPFFSNPCSLVFVGRDVDLEETASIRMIIQNLLNDHTIKEIWQSELSDLEEQAHVLDIVESVAKIGHWVVDLRKESLLWSDEVYDILELDPLKFSPTADGLADLYGPDAVQTSADELKKAVIDHTTFSFDLPLATATGRHIVVRNIGFCKYQNGRPVALIGTVRDITEEAETTEQLFDTKERYDLAIRGSSAGLWFWNIEKNSLFGSPKIFKMLGMTTSDYEPDINTFCELLHPDDLKKVKDCLTRHLKNEGDYKIEYRLRHAEGHYLWFYAEGQAIWNKEGRATKMGGSIVDITDRKQAFDEIEKIHATYEKFNRIIAQKELSLFEKIDRVLLLCLEQYGLTHANVYQFEEGQFRVLNAYTPDHDIQPEMLIDPRRTCCQYVFEEERLIAYANRSELPDDLTLPEENCDQAYIGIPFEVDNKSAGTLSFSAETPKETPFTTKDFNLIQVVSNWIGHEFAREKNEQTLILQREKAEAASKAKDAFLANMSHEIRTPLYGVTGYTELLANTELSESQEMFIQRIQDSANALLVIVNEVLDFAKIETGKLEIRVTDFNLKELMDKIKASFALKARDRGLKLSFIYEDDLPKTIHSDPNRLRQILSNLIENALKFTAEGSVKVRIQKAGTRQIKISVADTGPGIPRHDQRRVFDKFEQLDPTPTRRHGGAGLGLAISKELVTLLGGSLGLMSEPGQGSTFWFTIDICSPTLISRDSQT